jgi:hypothetical protein
MKSTVIPLHRGFIQVEDPYTKDCQEHHDWEDRDIVRRVMADEGASEVPMWQVALWALAVGFVVCLSSYSAAIVVQYIRAQDWSAYIADMGQALQALGQVGGAKQ